MHKRQVQYNIENFTSRIPGLFTFIEDGVVYKATSSIQGCYGKYVCDLRLDVNINVPKIKEDYLGNLIFESKYIENVYINLPEFEDDAIILQSKIAATGVYTNNTRLDDGTRVDSDGYIYHSYRTLMSLYYKYVVIKDVYNNKFYKKYFNSKTINEEYKVIRDKIENIKLFINFIEKGIGCYSVEELLDEYNSQVSPSLEISIDFNEAYLIPSKIYIVTASNLLDEMKYLQKSCEFYNSLSNNKKSDYSEYCCECQKFKIMGGDNMITLLEYCVKKAEEVSEIYSHYTNNNLYYNIQVPIIVSMSDMGVNEQYRPIWEPGVEYKEGDIVYYNGCTYVCKIDKSVGFYNEDYKYIEFPVDDFEKITNLSDYENFKQLNAFFSDDGGFNIKDDEGNIMQNYTITSKTSSRLRSLRRNKTFTDINGNKITPNNGTDWLCYYRKGVVENKKLTDRLANLEKIDKTLEDNLDYKNNYYIYGNVIDDIICNEIKDKDEKIFKYTINAHLRPTTITIGEDEEGNKLVYYRDLEKDSDSDNGKYQGMNYTEIYTIPYVDLSQQDAHEEGTFCSLIQGYEYFLFPSETPVCTNDGIPQTLKSFENKNNIVKVEGKNFYKCYYTYNDYINGQCVKYESKDNIYITLPIPDDKQYEFSTLNNITNYEVNSLNGKILIEDIVGEYQVDIENKPDYEYNNLYKTDYLMGIHYQPYVDENVYIERGNGDAYELHLKLMEVKTMQDLENYQNGGFFRIEKMN